MRCMFVATLVALVISACAEGVDHDDRPDRLHANSSSLSAAEQDEVYRAVLGVPASEVVQPDRSDADRSMATLRARLDPQLNRSDLERNNEVLRRRLDPSNTTM